MKTEDLVAVLARAAGPVDGRAVNRQFILTLLLAVLLCLAAMLLFLGIRPDWRSAVESPMFWIKLAFPASVAFASFALLRRLGYPGMRLGAIPTALGAPFAVLWLMALAVLAAAPVSARPGLIMGISWWQCPLLIAGLAVPAFVLSFRAISALAPTRLALTGAAAGIFAGSAAAFAYAFSCVETEAPFLAVWYVLGILIPTGAGAWLGRRLLRW
jgi:hypothetical protein